MFFPFYKKVWKTSLRWILFDLVETGDLFFELASICVFVPGGDCRHKDHMDRFHLPVLMQRRQTLGLQSKVCHFVCHWPVTVRATAASTQLVLLNMKHMHTHNTCTRITNIHEQSPYNFSINSVIKRAA